MSRQKMSFNVEKTEKVVAIHQPNFFPWLGYFDKIKRADTFIFMDNVQFPRTGRGTWINRVKFLVGGKPSWVTCPVKKTEGLMPIKEVKIDDSGRWRAKLLRSVEHSYGKAPYFKEYYPLFKELVEFNTQNIAEFNMNAILKICRILNINTEKIVLGSSLACKKSSTDLLIEMTTAVGGTAYMCGGGAGGYQDDEKINTAALKLIYQNFNHPEYKQGILERFEAGLSIIDALFWTGEETRSFLGKE